MIVDDKKSEFLATDDMNVQKFGISDTGFILDILRTKLYSNIIAAICREISCNARDANREAGRGDEPIEISMPTRSHMYLEIKDHGLGISPERVSNIFLNYGKSTKRDSNEFMGFYGLGSKTPFGYSDTFNISTVHDGIHYDYMAIIDETKVGQLIEINKYETSEKSGTTIIVPVLENNLFDFENEMRKATQYWNPRPIFNIDMQYSSIEEFISEDDWAIEKYNYLYGNSFTFIKANIDGVAYDCQISDFSSTKFGIIQNINGVVRLDLKIGEVSVAANREKLFFDDNTKSFLNQKIFNIENLIIEKIQSNIELEPDYLSAVALADEIKSKMFIYNNRLNFTWKGHSLNSNIPIKYYLVQRRRTPGTVLVSSHSSFNLSKKIDKNLIYINDFAENNDITQHNLATAFEKNKNLDKIYILLPSKEGDSCNEDYFNKNYNLSLINPKKISSLIRPRKKRKECVSKSVLYKYDKNTYRVSQTSQKEAKENTKIKVIAKSPYKDDFMYNGINLSRDCLSRLCALFPNVDFYLSTRDDVSNIHESLGFNYTIENFIQKNILDKFSVENVLKSSCLRTQVRSNFWNLIHFKFKKNDQIISHKSEILELFDLHNEIEASYKDALICGIYTYIYPKFNLLLQEYTNNNLDLNLSKKYQKSYDTYPMLRFVRSDFQEEDFISSVIEYIAMIDKMKEEE